MRVFIIILLIVALKVYSSTNIKGEPFPKPNKKLQEDVKTKNQERSEKNSLFFPVMQLSYNVTPII